MKLKKNYKFRYYLAGFFDGEGTISAKMNYPDRTHKNYVIYPSVEIGNTNKEIINTIIQYFPTTIRIAKYDKKRGNRKVFYRISWTKQKAIKVLKAIYPYLIIKKPQAKLCIELIKTYKLRFCKKGFKKVDKRTMIKRFLIWKNLKKLNKRGIIYKKYLEKVKLLLRKLK